MNETVYWLWLSMVFGTGSRRIWEAMCFFETATEAYCELSAENCRLNLTQEEIANIRSITLDQVRSLMEESEKKGVRAVGYSSEEYPHQLRHIVNPPAVLYYKGDISCLKGTRTVTSVGARYASDYSLRAAEEICSELARNGYVIVSGFALGIDIASHLAAVSANRPTACVMGCGVDVDYPKDNFRFRDMILENGGVFISEFPIGTPPHSSNFPKRNRILSALGRVSVVFEATDHSGSLITANLSAEQGREVFCLPPADIFSSAYSGNILLLRDGATPLYSAEDIMERFLIGGVNEQEIREEMYTGIDTFGVEPASSADKPKLDITRLARPKKGRRKKKAEKITEHNEVVEKKETEQNKADIIGSIPEGTLTDVQESIVKLLEGCSLHADVIMTKLEIEPASLMVELTELEMLGIVKALPGKMYSLC